MAEIEDLRIKFMALQATIKTEMKDVLDKIGIGSSDFRF